MDDYEAVTIAETKPFDMQAFFSKLQSMNPPDANPQPLQPNNPQPITAAEIEKMSLDEIASKDLDSLVGQTPPVETIHDISRDEKLEEIQSQLQMVLKLESKFDSVKTETSSSRKSSTFGQRIFSFILIAGIAYSISRSNKS